MWFLDLWRSFIGEIGWGFTKSKLLLSHYQDTFCLFYYIGFFTDGTKQGRIKVLARKHESKQAQTVPVITVLFTSTHRREKNTQTAVDGLQIRDCYYLKPGAVCGKQT